MGLVLNVKPGDAVAIGSAVVTPQQKGGNVVLHVAAPHNVRISRDIHEIHAPAYLGLEVLHSGEWIELARVDYVDFSKLSSGMRVVWHSTDNEHAECRTCDSPVDSCTCHYIYARG